jgi:hypothetical protein
VRVGGGSLGRDDVHDMAYTGLDMHSRRRKLLAWLSGAADYSRTRGEREAGLGGVQVQLAAGALQLGIV